MMYLLRVVQVLAVDSLSLLWVSLGPAPFLLMFLSKRNSIQTVKSTPQRVSEWQNLVEKKVILYSFDQKFPGVARYAFLSWIEVFKGHGYALCIPAKNFFCFEWSGKAVNHLL